MSDGEGELMPVTARGIGTVAWYHMQQSGHDDVVWNLMQDFLVCPHARDGCGSEYNSIQAL